MSGSRASRSPSLSPTTGLRQIAGSTNEPSCVEDLPASCDPLAEPWDSEWSDELVLPFWVPRIQNVRVRCGQHFEAIRVPAGEAVRAHALLGPDSGPVLASAYTQTWHFLLDLDATAPDSWDVPGTRLLRRSTILGIPPAHITYGRDVRWVVLPGLGKTDPAALKEAVAGRVLAPPTSPRRSRRSASSCR